MSFKRAEREFEAMQKMAPRPTIHNKGTRLMLYRSTALDEHEEACQSLIEQGVLSPDGSWKF